MSDIFHNFKSFSLNLDDISHHQGKENHNDINFSFSSVKNFFNCRMIEIGVAFALHLDAFMFQTRIEF